MAHNPKFCPQCRRTLPRSSFGYRSRGKTKTKYLRSWCRDCTRVAKKKYGDAYPEKIAETNKKQQEKRGKGGRHDYLMRLYGITLEQYDEILAIQGGGCAVCGRAAPRGDQTRLHVDHDHKTGKVRGILCWPCNSALGKFSDDPVKMRKAADYLETRPAERVLSETSDSR